MYTKEILCFFGYVRSSSVECYISIYLQAWLLEIVNFIQKFQLQVQSILQFAHQDFLEDELLYQKFLAGQF